MVRQQEKKTTKKRSNTFLSADAGIEELTEEDIKAFVYGDPLRSYLGLVDIKNHRAEDNLTSVKFRESASDATKFLNLLGL